MSAKGACEVAARFLAHRMRTVNEMRDHLEEKGFSKSEADAVIEEYEDLGYLDDAEYAKVYVEYACTKKRGRRRIERELKERGIDREIAENAVEDYIYENGVDEYEDALAIARGAANQRIGDDGNMTLSQREIGRIMRKLDRRGYGHGDIIKVIETLKGEMCGQIRKD